MPVIYCNIDMFAKNATLYLDEAAPLTNKRLGSYNISDISSILPTVCNEQNIYNIHLVGNRTYLQGIAEDIRNTDISKYNYNKIMIEVN